MSGLRQKALTPRQIALGCAPEFEWERPDFEEHFVIEEGSPDGVPEDDTYWPRSAKQFVKKHRTMEARLRAKGRIA